MGGDADKVTALRSRLEAMLTEQGGASTPAETVVRHSLGSAGPSSELPAVLAASPAAAPPTACGAPPFAVAPSPGPPSASGDFSTGRSRRASASDAERRVRFFAEAEEIDSAGARRARPLAPAGREAPPRPRSVGARLQAFLASAGRHIAGGSGHHARGSHPNGSGGGGQVVAHSGAAHGPAWEAAVAAAVRDTHADAAANPMYDTASARGAPRGGGGGGRDSCSPGPPGAGGGAVSILRRGSGGSEQSSVSSADLVLVLDHSPSGRAAKAKAAAHAQRPPGGWGSSQAIAAPRA